MSNSELTKRWLLIDAEGIVLGRLAVVIATLLRGKHKPSYAPNADDGDYVVVINALKVKMTGKKMSDDIRYRHTGYPGGIKTTTPNEILSGPFPEQLIVKAVKNMVPKGPLGRQQLKHLYVYPGATHDHEAQQPEVMDVGKLNEKNKFVRGGGN